MKVVSKVALVSILSLGMMLPVHAGDRERGDRYERGDRHERGDRVVNIYINKNRSWKKHKRYKKRHHKRFKRHMKRHFRHYNKRHKRGHRGYRPHHRSGWGHHKYGKRFNISINISK